MELSIRLPEEAVETVELTIFDTHETSREIRLRVEVVPAKRPVPADWKEFHDRFKEAQALSGHNNESLANAILSSVGVVRAASKTSIWRLVVGDSSISARNEAVVGHCERLMGCPEGFLTSEFRAAIERRRQSALQPVDRRKSPTLTFVKHHVRLFLTGDTPTTLEDRTFVPRVSNVRTVMFTSSRPASLAAGSQDRVEFSAKANCELIEQVELSPGKTQATFRLDQPTVAGEPQTVTIERRYLDGLSEGRWTLTPIRYTESFVLEVTRHKSDRGRPAWRLNAVKPVERDRPDLFGIPIAEIPGQGLSETFEQLEPGLSYGIAWE